MLEFRKLALLLAAAAGLAAGQPALTTIQDILYRADGTRFNGTMFIQYNSFLAGDTSNIATANLTLQIVNGVLNVKLVPTTTASAGAQYNVTYNSQGVIQFTEIWAVPPSTLALRVKDVRVSSGSVVGPAPITSPVQISDVVGLPNSLAVRPQEGVGFAISRAAIINQAGQIDGASGSLSDCVRVDGSSGPCGGSGSSLLPSFSDGEVPAGLVNGINQVFTLANAPSPVASLDLYRNGLMMQAGTDYTLTGNAISFLLNATPQIGDVLTANYRYANPNNPLGTLTSPQVICSTLGITTSATTIGSLGTCTIPAGLLGNGDRIEVDFQYGHSGTSTGFTGEIDWGGTVILSRAATSAESALVGRVTLGISAGAQSWDAQTWGAALSLATAAGSAAENTSANVTINFRGDMAAATGDTITARNFTVIRYPAQTNP